MKKLIVIVLLALLPGCAGFLRFDPSFAPAYTVLKCKAKVVAPYVGDIADSLVAQTESTDQADIGKLLLNLGVPLLELKAVGDAYRKCGAPTEVPVPVVTTPDAGVVSQ